MNTAPQKRPRLEKLAALLRENHVTEQAAKQEAKTGEAAARREELSKRTNWKAKEETKCNS